VHLSAARALPIIRSAKAAGHKLTVETCFHYLCLASDSIPDGRPEFKCCPPIRDAANREALWAALLDGTIDCVVSDHSPCVAELKKLDQGDHHGSVGWHKHSRVWAESVVDGGTETQRAHWDDPAMGEREIRQAMLALATERAKSQSGMMQI
jgi:hypothetical protein